MKILNITKENLEYKIIATYYHCEIISNSIFSIKFYNKNIEIPQSVTILFKLGNTKNENYYKNEYLKYNEHKKFAHFIADHLKLQKKLDIGCYF